MRLKEQNNSLLSLKEEYEGRWIDIYSQGKIPNESGKLIEVEDADIILHPHTKIIYPSKKGIIYSKWILQDKPSRLKGINLSQYIIEHTTKKNIENFCKRQNQESLEKVISYQNSLEIDERFEKLKNKWYKIMFLGTREQYVGKVKNILINKGEGEIVLNPYEKSVLNKEHEIYLYKIENKEMMIPFSIKNTIFDSTSEEEVRFEQKINNQKRIIESKISDKE